MANLSISNWNFSTTNFNNFAKRKFNILANSDFINIGIWKAGISCFKNPVKFLKFRNLKIPIFKIENYNKTNGGIIKSLKYILKP